MTGLLLRAKSRYAMNDDGFSMIEIVMSLLIIAIVTTGSLSFFINNLRSVNGQGQRQQAVYLANQQLETVQSVPVASLVTGRTSAAVTTLFGTTAATRLKISTQDNTSSSSDYDPTASASATPTIPTQSSQTVNGVSYTTYTFIDACFFTVSTGVCGPTSSSATTQEYRVSVDVAWQSNGNCYNGCDYSTSTLIDPTANPTFNSNISAPVGSYFSVGSNTNPGLTPAISADSQITDSAACSITTSSGTYNSGGTEIEVTGSNFKTNIRVWVSAGGGSIPTASIAQPVAGEVDFCYQSSDVPGTYTISVINTDGGHFQLPITVNPSISSVSGWDPTNKKLTVTGSGFQAGMVFSVSGGGASFTTTATPSYNNAIGTPDTVVLTNYVGPKDGGTTTFTTTTADNNYSGTFTTAPAPAITSVTPTAVATGATKTVALAGTNFITSGTNLTTLVPVANGAATGFSASSTTAATFTAVPGAVGTPQTFYVYNGDGGFTSTKSITVDAQPTITAGSVAPASLTAGTATTVTATGTGFASGMTVSSNNGTAGTITLSGTTGISIANVRATTSPTVTLTLTNPDGGTVSFVINVNPSLTGESPTTAVPTGANTTITVTGTGFRSGITASATNGTAVATYVSATSATVVVKPTTTNTDTITLTNNDGSTAMTFTISTTPNVTGLVGLSPNPAKHSQSGQTWTISGFGFASGSGLAVTMKEGASTLTVSGVTFVNANTIRVTAVPTASTGSQNFKVTVTNPDASTFTSGNIAVSMS